MSIAFKWFLNGIVNFWVYDEKIVTGFEFASLALKVSRHMVAVTWIVLRAALPICMVKETALGEFGRRWTPLGF